MTTEMTPWDGNGKVFLRLFFWTQDSGADSGKQSAEMTEHGHKSRFFRFQAGAVIRDICFFIQNRDDYTVSFLPGAFHDVICGKCGKCGVLHKFSQDVHFLLQEKTGGRHLAAAQSVPESDMGVEKKGLSVQIL